MTPHSTAPHSMTPHSMTPPAMAPSTERFAMAPSTASPEIASATQHINMEDFNEKFELKININSFSDVVAVHCKKAFDKGKTKPFLQQYIKSTKGTSEPLQCGIHPNKNFQCTLFSIMYLLLKKKTNLANILKNGVSMLALINITAHGIYSQCQDRSNKSLMSCLRLSDRLQGSKITKLNYAAIGCNRPYIISRRGDNFNNGILESAYFFNQVEKIEDENGYKLEEQLSNIAQEMQEVFGEHEAALINTYQTDPSARHPDTESLHREHKDIRPDECFQTHVTGEEINCINRAYFPINEDSSSAIIIKLYVKQPSDEDINILSLYLKITPDGKINLLNGTIEVSTFYLSDILFAIRFVLLYISEFKKDQIARFEKFATLPTHYFIAEGACIGLSSCFNPVFKGLGGMGKTKKQKRKTKNKTKNKNKKQKQKQKQTK